MPSGSIESHADALKYLNNALESDKGLILRFDTHATAARFRFKLYSARGKDRELSRKSYEAADPLHGKSAYDGLSIYGPKKAEGFWTLTIEVSNEPPGLIEAIEIK